MKFCNNLLTRFKLADSKRPISSLLYNLSSNVANVDNNKAIFLLENIKKKLIEDFSDLSIVIKN